MRARVSKSPSSPSRSSNYRPLKMNSENIVYIIYMLKQTGFMPEAYSLEDCNNPDFQEFTCDELVNKEKRRVRGENVDSFYTDDQLLSRHGLCCSRKANESDEAEVIDLNGEPIKVFILIGQSNMYGPGRKKNEFHPSLQNFCKKEPVYRMEYTDNVQGWVKLVPNSRTYNGPEISFARYMSRELGRSRQELCNRIGVIKVARGETGIRAFLPPASGEIVPHTSDAEYTFEKAAYTADICKGPLYKLIWEKINHASDISEPQFEGIIMKQGAKDMNTPDSSNHYLQQVNHIAEQIRQDTGEPELPLYVSTYWSESDLHNMTRSQINQIFQPRQHAVSVLNQLAVAYTLDYTYVVPHGWLPVASDNAHFCTESQEVFGCLLAAHVLRGVIQYSYDAPPQKPMFLLDRNVATPGAVVQATANFLEPGTTLTLSLAYSQVASTVVSENGTFLTDFRVPAIAPDQYEVTLEQCHRVIASARLTIN